MTSASGMRAQVPQGATPRSLVVHLRASLTRTCKPGDAVIVSGIFLPQPYTGFKAMRAGLLTTTFLEAMSVTQEKKSYAQTAEDATLRAQIDVRDGPPLLTFMCTCASVPPALHARRLHFLLNGQCKQETWNPPSVHQPCLMRTLMRHPHLVVSCILWN